MPQAPANPDAAGDAAAPKGGVQDLIVGIHSDLMKFKELIMGVPQVPDELKQQLDGVVSGYKGFVDSLAQLGGKAPEAAPEQAAPAPQGPMGGMPKKGPMPMNAGKGAVPAL